MMITFHASKHRTTGVRKDAHTPCCARWRNELAVAAGMSCSDTSTGLHKENFVCAQKSTSSSMCRNQWRILTATSHFPNTENGQTFWGSRRCKGFGEGGDAEVLLQTPTPRQPGCVTPTSCSTGRILHSCHTLLLLNPLPAWGTGRKRHRQQAGLYGQFVISRASNSFEQEVSQRQEGLRCTLQERGSRTGLRANLPHRQAHLCAFHRDKAAGDNVPFNPC